MGEEDGSSDEANGGGGGFAGSTSGRFLKGLMISLLHDLRSHHKLQSLLS